MLSSFRAAALSAHLRPQPHSRPAAGTTNNLWWAVVDFLAELPQAGFPCSGEVFFDILLVDSKKGMSAAAVTPPPSTRASSQQPPCCIDGAPGLISSFPP